MFLYVKLNQNRFIKYYSTEPYEDYQRVSIDEHYASFVPKYYDLMWVDNGVIQTDQVPTTIYEKELEGTENAILERNDNVNNRISNLDSKISNYIDNNIKASSDYDKNRVAELDQKISDQIDVNNSILTPIKSYIGHDEAMYAAENSSRPLLCVYPSETQPGKSVVMKSIYSYGSKQLPNIDRIEITNPNTNNYQFNNVYASFDQQNKKIYLHGSISYKMTINANATIARIPLEDLKLNNITGQWLQYQTINIGISVKRNKILIKNQYQQNTTINLDNVSINVEYDSSLKPSFPAGMPERFDVLEDGESIYNIKESPAMYYVPDNTDIGGVYNPYGTGRGFIAQKTQYSNYIQTVPLGNNTTSYFYYLYPTSYGSYTNCFYGALTPYTTEDFVSYALTIRNLSRSTMIGSNTPKQTW